MNIKDCFWEKENLGCTACEIDLSEGELLPPIDEFNEMNSNYCYQVVKAKTKNIALCQQLSQYGFYLTETQLDVVFNRESYDKMGKYCRRFYDNISLQFCEDQDSSISVINKIDNGMFYTDRIALDPNFNLTIANRRYRNWIINTLKDDNHKLCLVLCNNIEIGLGYFSIESNYIHYILGGIFPEYQLQGLGITIPLIPVSYMINQNLKKIVTSISSNNINVVKCYLECGYFISNFKYVFSRFRP